MNLSLINWLTTFGIIFEIAGIIILFKHGLPSKVKLNAGGQMLKEAEHHSAKEHNTKIKTISYLGLIIVIIGVLLQILGANSKAIDL